MGRLCYLIFVCIVIQSAVEVQAQVLEECPDGTLLEPYAQECAIVNDRREWWLTPSESAAAIQALLAPDLDKLRHNPVTPVVQKADADEPPEPGAINAGTTYLDGALAATTSAWLHTRMFVRPEGISPSEFLGWTFMPATNRVDSAVEVVAIYRTALGNSGVLSIFGRPCSVNYPCPDGDTSNGWQPSKEFTELACNVTHFVDDGGHAQKIVHYANHSDRLDDGDPPLWRNSVYLWNYCAENWDLIWLHEYRENKRDCATEGCYWWGPGFELPGDPFPRPQVAEIGFEDTLLYHDGVWSELRPDETGFRNPEDRPDLSPWLLFHHDPNRSFGAGNWLDVNDPPVIESQNMLTTPEDEPLEINSEAIVVSDPDVDLAFHVAYALTVYNGDNYEQADGVVTPARDYTGVLTVPITVSDGAADSEIFALSIDVTPVNDAPVITGQNSVSTLERTPLEITLQHVVVDDPDNDTSELQLTVQDGAGFDRNGNIIVPLPGVIGELVVPVFVSDGVTDSAVFNLLVTVEADTVPLPPAQSDGGACFIATATYGSYLDPHVQVLRTFRDRRLMTNRPGREFVAFYYQHSPPIALVISENRLLKALVRVLLTPIVYGLAYPKITMVLLATIVLLALRMRNAVRSQIRSSQARLLSSRHAGCVGRNAGPF